MSDLVKEANYLRFYHTSADMMKDKDMQKNALFKDYARRVGALLTIPVGF